ncbi:MAG TPA: hypothetical protein VN829_23135 [Dongiaceae bacterium]|nr:hypothetical protein [Dongiaceae bacterium]
MLDSGEWLACDSCADLIEAGAAASLVLRALDNNPTTKGKWGGEDRAQMEFLVAHFLSMERSRIAYEQCA